MRCCFVSEFMFNNDIVLTLSKRWLNQAKQPNQPYQLTQYSQPNQPNHPQPF